MAATPLDTPPLSSPLRHAGRPAVVWLAWAVAAAASVQLAPNPVYVALVVAIAAVAVQGHHLDSRLARAFPLLIGVGLAFGLVRIVLNALTTHGVGRVLFTLPEATLPRLLGGFTVGGTIEAPVVQQAAIEGWAIVGILGAFGAFNAVVSHYELVRAAPKAFFELGLATTVAIAFIPSTVASIAAVRESDRARTGGAVVRRGRLVRQISPVLETGMERAVGLAESMDSRGFGRDSSRREVFGGWFGLGGMLLLGAAFVGLVAQERAVGAACAGAGLVSMVIAVWLTSTASRRSSYRRRPMATTDWALCAVAISAPVLLAVAGALGDPTLRSSGDTPVPGIGLVPLLGIALLAATPIATTRTSR